MSGLRLLAYLAAVLVASLAALSTTYTPRAIASVSEESDCLFLLAIVDRVLEYAVSGDARGVVVASYMLNASVPRDIALTHERVYRLVLDYYTAVSPEGNVSISRLRKLLSELSEVPAYVDRLSKCSHDPEAAKALRARVSLKLDALSSSLNKLVEDLRYGVCGWVSYEISPQVSTYTPGDRLYVSIKNAVNGVVVELYTWPQLQLVARAPQCRDHDCLLEVEIPGAKSLVERGVSPNLVIQLALLARVGSSTCFLGLLRVSYHTPSLFVDVPRIVKKGSTVPIAIYSSEDYEISAHLNNVLVYSGVASSSGVLLELSTLEDPVRTGLNVLRVCVNASTRTIPYCFQSTFAVELRHPRVEVHVPSISVSWLGYTTISLINKERVLVDSAVSVNGMRVYRGFLESSGSTTITVFAGYLPVQKVSVDVRLGAAEEGYDEVVAQYEVLCVSILPSIAVTTAVFVAPLLISDIENSFIVSIRSMSRVSGASRRISKSLAKVLEPYVLGLGSSIASLYYSLLRRLRVRLPLDQETLREHFSSSIESLPLKAKVKKLLWVFLMLVERDLYSRRRSDYEEARELYRGVLSEARE